MKNFLIYIYGLILLFSSAFLALNGRGIELVHTPAEASVSTTTYSLTCRGANIFAAPTGVTAEFEIDPLTGSLVNPPSVIVTDPIRGGDTQLGVVSGDSTTSGWGYSIFRSPNMAHVYACVGDNRARRGRLSWRFTADNPNMYLGSAGANATRENQFTKIKGTFTNIINNMPFAPNRPVVIYTEGNRRMILKGALDLANPGSSGESIGAIFESTIRN